jgi:hypothetical protein
MNLGHAVPIGNQFFSGTVPAGNTQIIAPTTNATGLIIRTLWCSLSGTYMVIYADTTAPTANPDFTKRTIFDAITQSNVSTAVMLPYPLYIPPGLGIWFGSGTGVTVGMTYDLVDLRTY